VTSSASACYGSKLEYTSDGVHYTKVAQLRKIVPDGSKQTIVDQTNILTAGNGSAPLAVRFNSGEIAIDGVLAPGDGSQLALGTLHATLAVVTWRITYPDGESTYVFLGSVSEYKPFDIDVKKAMTFSAKIRVAGAFTSPAGAA
jgi:hypothetical protein